MPKALSLAVVMDPIAKIKFAKDSTLAMLLAAAARGWKLTYFEQSDLFLRDGVALGRGRPLEVHDDSRRWFELGDSSRATSSASSTASSCARIRRSTPSTSTPPTSSSAPSSQGAFVANKPQGLRDMNEKVFTAWFPQCCAPTLITRSAADITRVRRRARQDRRQAAGRHGRQVHLRHRDRATRTCRSSSKR